MKVLVYIFNRWWAKTTKHQRSLQFNSKQSRPLKKKVKNLNCKNWWRATLTSTLSKMEKSNVVWQVISLRQLWKTSKHILNQNLLKRGLKVNLISLNMKNSWYLSREILISCFVVWLEPNYPRKKLQLKDMWTAENLNSEWNKVIVFLS